MYAYMAYGVEFINRLEGAFHCAILDQDRSELIIANDRFGLRPLYWTHYLGRLAFAPEVKALLLDPALNKTLDLTAVAEYMRFQHLLGEKTFFEGVSLLDGAFLLRYSLVEKKVTVSKYWSFSDISSIDTKPAYADLVREAARLFEGAVEMMSRSERVGLYLSGGLDSRLIAGCLAKKGVSFSTITYGDKESADVTLAGRVASLVGSDHHYYDLVNGKWVLEYAGLHLDLTEGFHSWIHAHGISTLGRVRDFLQINLTGWAVDTGLGGHYWDPLLNQATDELSYVCYLYSLYNQQYTWPGLTEAEEAALYTEAYRSRMRGLAFDSFCRENIKLEAFPFEQRAEYFHMLNHNRRLTQNYIVFNSSHFENRFPGCDYPLFDFIFSFPLAWRPNRQLEKDVIEHVDRRLALIPSAKDGLLFTRRRGRRIAHHIVTRLKQRTNRHVAPIFWQPVSLYADYENWLRHELKDWAIGLLLDGRLESRGMFNMDLVRSLLNRHFSGRELHTIGKIAPLMTLEMMMRAYFD
jgi:asparagine synthase (glutamine-hydrolysing)